MDNIIDDKIIFDSKILTSMKQNTSFAKKEIDLKTVKHINLIRKVYNNDYNLPIEDLLSVLEEMDFLMIDNDEISVKVKTVLHLKFDVGIDDYCELDEVIKTGKFDIVKVLTYKNEDVKKCILLAIEGAKYELVKGIQVKIMLFFMEMLKEFSIKDNFDFLNEAAKYGNKEIVKYLIKYNEPIKTDRVVRHLVHNSLRNGNYESFIILVKFYNYDYSDLFNDSNIDYALEGGNHNLIDEIISVSKITSVFQIAIMSLEYNNSSFRYLNKMYDFSDDEMKQIFAKSIEKNNNYAIKIFPNVNFDDSKYISYVAKKALKHNKIDVFNKIVDVGIDFLTVDNKEGDSFLISAIMGNTNIEVIKFILLKCGNITENDFDKAVKSTIEHGNLDILEILLPENFIPDNYDFLKLSTKFKHYDIIEFLLKKYHCICDLYCAEDVEELSEAIYFSGEIEEDIKIINLFLEYTNTKNEMLLVSIFKDRFDLVNYFLNIGVSLNKIDDYLPLSMLVDLTHFEFVEFNILDSFKTLIKMGAKFDLTEKCFCDFGYEQFDKEFAEYILSIGLKVTIFDLEEINSKIMMLEDYRRYRFSSKNFKDIVKVIIENVYFSNDEIDKKKYLIYNITKKIKQL